MSARFQVRPTPLEGLVVLERSVHRDDRGRLERLYCSEELRPWLGGATVTQSNLTHTGRRGTVRGMHLQTPPHAEDKLVTCLQGRVWDVAVDVREGSPTFLQWYAEILDGSKNRTMLIPKGFAHGFQTLTDDCIMLYFHTSSHAPKSELGLDALDARLAIAWPEAVLHRSPRDCTHPSIGPSFTGIRS